MPLIREQEQPNVILQTTEVRKLGSVNTNQLVIEVEGKIEKNQIHDTSTLCVVLIPEGTPICGAVSKFRDIGQSLDKGNPYVLLPENEGAVYYGSDLSANEKGNVSPRIFLQGGLQAGDYMAYLIVHHITYGTYCSPKGQPVIVPEVEDDNSTITMVSVNPKITRNLSNNDPILIIDAQATAENYDQKKGGFLFIEEKDIQVEPIKLLAGLIKDEQSIPITTGFQKMDDIPGIIIHSFQDGTDSAKAKNVNVLSSEYKDKLFKKGATYQVYAYLVDDNYNYTVSPQKDKIITIPKAEAKLEMVDASINGMIQDLDDPNPGKINIKLVGKIESMEDVNDPQVGFLFVEGTLTSYEGAVNNIETLLDKPNVDGFHKDAGTNIIYAEAVGAYLHIGERTFNRRAVQSPFELGKEYYVYFWLKDGSGQIFISSNSYTLSIPKVELVIEEFSFNRLGHELIIEHKEEIRINQPTPGIVGYLLCQEGTIQNMSLIFENTSQYIAASKQTNQSPKSPNLISPDKKVAFLDLPTLNDKQMFTAECNRMFGKNVPDSTKYTPYLIHATENAIFYRKAPEGKHFTWYESNHKVDRTTLDLDIDGNGEIKSFEVSYTMDRGEFTNMEIMEKSDVGGVKQWNQVIPAVDGSNKEKIEKIVRKIVRGNDAYVNARIGNLFRNRIIENSAQ
ncbi:hypothetical protein [Candidatus Amoebophilus asiaticus]|nr:hypothetical protein [Candidatus Amoebophilus asiaticus]